LRHEGFASHRDHIIGIDLYRCALANEADSDDEARSWSLPNQVPTETLEGAAPHFDGHPRLEKWVRINGEGAGDQASHSLDLSLRDRNAIAAYSQHLYDTWGGQYPQPILPGEVREAIAREQRELDLRRTVFPTTPPTDERKEYLDAFAIELSPHPFLMPGAGAERVPVGNRNHRFLQPPVRPLTCGARLLRYDDEIRTAQNTHGLPFPASLVRRP
jgi:hypothetical protein